MLWCLVRDHLCFCENSEYIKRVHPTANVCVCVCVCVCVVCVCMHISAETCVITAQSVEFFSHYNGNEEKARPSQCTE